MTNQNTLARGAALNKATFDDFITRLRHHCEGGGVDWHCTADAIFNVQQRVITWGYDPAHSDNSAFFQPDECRYWVDAEDFYKQLDEDEQDRIDTIALEYFDASFCMLSRTDQIELIEENSALGYTIGYWKDHWKTINSHFTREAADAWIQRKSHDYPDGLRVYVNAQTHCWEWNAIKQALIDGRLVLKGAK